MGKKLYTKDDNGIRIETDRKIGDVRIPNYVFDLWMPLLGAEVIGVYATYCRLEHEQTIKGLKMDDIARACRIGKTKLLDINKKLAQLGFVTVEIPKGKERLMHYTTVLTVHDPPTSIDEQAIKDHGHPKGYKPLAHWLIKDVGLPEVLHRTSGGATQDARTVLDGTSNVLNPSSIETPIEKTLSPVAVAPVVTPPEPAASKPEDVPVQRDAHIDALMESLTPLVETIPPAPAPPRAPHPPGFYVQHGQDGRDLTGAFHNYSAAHTFALSLTPPGTVTQTPPADLIAIPPAKPGKKTSDAPRAPKRDALFVAVARYLSLPDETPEAPYPKTRCKRVNQVKGYVLDVAGRPAAPDYAALAAKLDGFAAWCKGQGFSAPKEEVKFTGRFNEYYRSANGNGNGGALPRDDFAEKWYSSRMAYYKRENGQLYRKPIGAGAEWRKAGEND